MDDALRAMTTAIGSETAQERRPKIELAIFAIYALLVIIGVATHEPWRDEIRAFTISLHSNSPAKLFDLIQSEGHPLLWHALLKPFTLFPNQRGLKLAGLVAALPSAWVIFRMLPLPLWIRTGVLFSYYWLYEYAVLSRSYAIGFMLTALGMVLWLRQRSLRIAAALFGLAANVHILIALTNLPLLGYLFWQQARPQQRRWSRSTLSIVLALLLLSYATAFGSIAQTKAMQYGTRRIEIRVKRYLGLKVNPQSKAPAISAGPTTQSATEPKPSSQPATPAPTTTSEASASDVQRLPRLKGKLLQLTSDSFKSIEILRDFKNNLEATAWILLQISGVAIAIAVFLTAPLVGLIYLLPAFAIAQGLSEFIYAYSVWHKGIYTMILLFSLVLCRTRQDSDQSRSAWLTRGWLPAINAAGFVPRLGAISLTIFLSMGIFLGVNAWIKDVRLPFSGGQAAGFYLRQQGVPANNLLLYDSPLGESGISLAYRMVPLRADPAEAPALLTWPRHGHFTWKPPEEVQRFCDGAKALAVNSGAKSALVRLIGPMQTPNQPICPEATAHFFPGLREPVQIELFDPAKLPRQGAGDAT